MVGRRVGSASSPLNCFREVLLFPFWFCVIFSLVWKLTLEVNTLPWFWQALSFLTCWYVEKQPESWTERRGAVLFWGESRLEGEHSSNLTSCPLTFCPIPVPWNQFTRWTCLPTQPECAGTLEWLPGSPPNREGNGNPLQYSCLENPRNRGAWWAAVYGVTQSWTQLKRLSSSSGCPPEGSPGAPGRVNPAGERLGARPQHWPPGGPGRPTQRRAWLPEKPAQPQSPDI